MAVPSKPFIRISGVLIFINEIDPLHTPAINMNPAFGCPFKVNWTKNIKLKTNLNF
jgi:hypothetical protein